MLLAIDTSTRYAGVAFVDEQGLLTQLMHWRSIRNHTVELMPAIDRILERAEALLKDVSCIAIARGPGNFSALRAGLSVAKGLAWTFGLPVVAPTTLAIEAYTHHAYNNPICSILDVGRNQLAWAVFEGTNGILSQITDETISDPVEFMASIPPKALICGEGLEKFGDVLRISSHNQATFAFPYLPSQRVASLASLAWQRFHTGDVESANTLRPLYLRRPTITPPKRAIAKQLNP